jgi:hypothetical protein
MCKGIAKKTILVTAFVFAMMGIAVIVTSTTAIEETSDFESAAPLFRKSAMDVASQVVVVCGAVTMAFSFLGLAGVHYNQVGFLKSYIVIVGCVIVLQLGMGSFLISRDINSDLGPSFKDTSQGQANIDSRQRYMDYLHCCGWSVSYDMEGDGPQCTGSPGGPGYSSGCTDQNGAVQLECWPPCEQATQDFVDTNVYPCGLAAVVIAALELPFLLLSCWIIMKTKKDTDDFHDDPFHY